MFCFLDCETLPTEDPALIAELAADIKPPRTMSKAETIARWEAEEKLALIEERTRATALDATFGRILAIGYAFDEAAPQVFINPDERQVLAAFFDALGVQAMLKVDGGGEYARDVVFVGHNVASFDMRFIWQRAVINGIKPPPALRRAIKEKPWAGVVQDTMTLWNPERDRRVSLERLCRALGVENPKGELTGATIFDAYKRGELDKIADYCKGDVRAVRDCYRRMQFIERAA